MPTPSLRIVVAYTRRTDDTEDQAEHLRDLDVEPVVDALVELGHHAEAVDVAGDEVDVVRRLEARDPHLIFNLAEGSGGVWREAAFPMLYEFMGIPYTGAGPGTLGLGLNKRMTEELLRLRGVHVPKGRLVTPDEPNIPDEMDYPLLIKPNYEGSSMGIHQSSIVHDQDEAQALADQMLKEYSEGLDVEEYIEGRELQIGFLSEFDRVLTEIVEYRFHDNEHNIMDYETKQAGGDEAKVETIAPAPLTKRERDAVIDTAVRAFSALRLRDLGRADIRLKEDGTAVLLEVNPLPGLRTVSPMITGAEAAGLEYKDVMRLIVRSAAKRYDMLGEIIAT